MSSINDPHDKLPALSSLLSEHIDALRQQAGKEYQSIIKGKLSEEEYINNQVSRQLDLEELADHDLQTELLNHRAFHARLLKILVASRRVERSDDETIGCLVACDINNLKQFNNKYGHAKTNRLIQIHAEIFKRGIRANDLAARVDINQFMLFLDGITPEQALQIAQERIKPEIGREVNQVLGNTEVVTYLSIGIIPLWKEMADRATEENIEDITESVQEALYVAKVNPDRIAFSVGDGNYQVIGE